MKKSYNTNFGRFEPSLYLHVTDKNSYELIEKNHDFDTTDLYLQ